MARSFEINVILAYVKNIKLFLARSKIMSGK